MTNDELRQLIESNARAIQGNSESISRLEEKLEALADQSIRTDSKIENLSVKLDRLSDIVLGNYRNIVRVETGTTNNEGNFLDALERINDLERRLQALEDRQPDGG